MYELYYRTSFKGRTGYRYVGTFDNLKEAKAAGKAVEARIGLPTGGYSHVHSETGCSIIRRERL